MFKTCQAEMVTNIITDLSIHTVSASIEAVLFDFSGTLLADSYVHHGLANLADLLDAPAYEELIEEH